MPQEVSNISGQLLLVFYNTGKTLLGLIPYVFAGIFLGEIFRNLSWMDEFSR